MPASNMARRTGASGDARPHFSSPGLVEPDPLPCLPGEPPAAAWAESGLPPDGFSYLGARKTARAWLMPCPSCCRGWVPLAPDHHDATGYRIAVEVGCSAGCDDPGELTLMHFLRLGELPPREPVTADERAERYVRGAARHAARRIAQAADPARQLQREAFTLGGLAAGAGTDPAAVARALAVTARHVGVPAEIAVPIIGKYVRAGTARPRGIAS